MVVALLISFAFHAALLIFFDVGQVTQKSETQGVLQVNLVTPPDDLPALESDIFLPYGYLAVSAISASSRTISVQNMKLSKSVGDRYFLYDEVDKKAEFTYAAPIANLEILNSTDSKGRVKVRVLINEFGNVDSAVVLEAEPSEIYNGMALSALLASKFSPAEKDGIAVKSQKILEIKFGMQSAN